MKRFCLASALLSISVPWLIAQEVSPDTQAGDFVFRIPSGWNRVDKDGTTYIYPSTAPPGNTTYISLTADDIRSDLRTSFNTNWDGFKKKYRILEGGEIGAGRLATGNDAFYTAAIASDHKGRHWKVFVLGAQYGKRMETITYLSDVFHPELAETYETALQSFLLSLRFGTAKNTA